MIVNSELIEVARHSSQSTEAVLRAYLGKGSDKIRERVRISAETLGIEPPLSRPDDSETRELDFDNVSVSFENGLLDVFVPYKAKEVKEFKIK